MSEFEKVFESSPTIRLIRIIETPENYSTEAIKAAKKVVDSRTDKEDAIELFKKETEQTQNRKAKRDKLEGEIRKRIGSILDLVNPLHRGVVTAEKRLKRFVLFFAVLSVYLIVKEFYLILFMITNGGSWELVPYILVPVSTYLLYKRTKVGWGLLYSWSIVNCFGSISGAVIMWNYKPSGIPAFDLLIPQTPPLQLLLGGLLVGVVIVGLLNKSMREILVLDKRTIIIWTAVGAGFLIINFFF